KKKHKDKVLSIYKISGILGKKNPLAYFHLYKDGSMTDTISVAFYSMDASYKRADSTEIFYGYLIQINSYGGNYKVQKISESISARLQDVLDSEKKKK
ncbi:MAG TPA: hypothetical protein VK787_03800, partial [Puia sp.]|nr:hypothetical protein [Puia sp.]